MARNEYLTSYVRWSKVPVLSDPVIIMGFEGWSNAGGVSVDTLDHLREFLEPETFATFGAEPFLIYTAQRPVCHIEGGLIRRLEPMMTAFSYRANPSGTHDLIFVTAREPDLNWELFTHILFGVMTRLGVGRLFTVGGVQDQVSHADPPKVSVVASSPSALAALVDEDEDIVKASYFGPVSIHSRIIAMCAETGIEGISLWGHVPSYLQKNPRVVARTVEIIARSVSIECPVNDLVRKSIEMDRRINEILARDPGLRQVVLAAEGKNSSREAAADDKIIRLNDFLRRDFLRDPS
jgi:proteasome assembly chaperone (PAC2) family protein